MPHLVNNNFRQRVEAVVSQIPRGKVMTYGQIATICGSPRSARIVGGIAHFGDSSLPWQRVVMKNGGLARGFPGGLSGHRRALQSDGIEVNDEYKVNIEKFLWHPAL